MKVFWSPLAVARVREEVQYIAKDRPGAVERWARIVYRIDGETIRVLTVRHGRRLLDLSEVESGIFPARFTRR